MAELSTFIRYLNVVLFAALEVMSLRQWRRRREPAAAWVVATFGLLGLVAVAGVFLPQDGRGVVYVVAQRLLVATLLGFPYCLYRFAAVFEPVAARMDRSANALTLLVIAATALLPRFPAPGEPRGALFQLYIALILLQWTVLSLFVAVRLWRAGDGKPTVARRRMRLLGLASGAMNVALIIAGLVPAGEEPTASSVVSQLLATTSALLFFIGFAPPGMLRLTWRRPEEQALQAAQLDLMRASTVDEVIESMLPPVVAVLGAAGAAVRADDGSLVGEFHPPAASSPAASSPAASPDQGAVIEVPLQHGTLQLWAGAHTPYFGQEELDLLTRYGIVVDLAWSRCLLVEREREAATRLAENERRLQEAQHIAHIGAWEWHIAGDTVIWSDELYRIFGVQPQSFPATFEGFLEYVHPEDRALVASAVGQAVTDGKPFAFDHRIVRPDGGVRVLHGQGRVITGADGTPERMVGTGQDVTDRKVAEDALVDSYARERDARLAFERTNAELESFVYSVSHDLKSPIISLLGYLDYLKLDFGDALPPDAAHYVERMTASAAYMDALIQDLLELSRVGRTQTEAEAVDVAALLREVVAEVSVAHPHASVRTGPLPVLYCNPVRLRQLLTNLIVNAMEHAGRSDVTVLVEARDLADGSVQLTVSDDGRGIPPEYRERVFGVFERLEAADAPERGTGIGLAICRKIMESFGGTVMAGDSPAGARIVLLFPPTTVRRPVGAGAEVHS